MYLYFNLRYTVHFWGGLHHIFYIVTSQAYLNRIPVQNQGVNLSQYIWGRRSLVGKGGLLWGIVGEINRCVLRGCSDAECDIGVVTRFVGGGCVFMGFIWVRILGRCVGKIAIGIWRKINGFFVFNTPYVIKLKPHKIIVL